MLTLGYSNIVKLLVEISVLKHAKYTKTVTRKCETVIQKCYTEKIKSDKKVLHVTVFDICKLILTQLQNRNSDRTLSRSRLVFDTMSLRHILPPLLVLMEYQASAS